MPDKTTTKYELTDWGKRLAYDAERGLAEGTTSKLSDLGTLLVSLNNAGPSSLEELAEARQIDVGDIPKLLAPVERALERRYIKEV